MTYTPIRLSEDELLGHLPKAIGQVSLNYDYYPGEDLYSDGTIEDEILNIVKKHSRPEFQSVIEQGKSWPILYHLSALRGNIVEFLPITKKDKVLEIGSGCGAITDVISSKAGKVTCIDLSAKRSQINAYRNSDRDNIEIMVGNFEDIEPHLDEDYDYVTLIGVFEYGSSYINSTTPYEDFLRKALKHVKKNGRVVIAIENKFGLKYWAGCTEDHNGEFFSSLEGYPQGGSARTFTRNGFQSLFDSCGVEEYSFLYPYPDYKLPHTIYSDARLPYKGELSDNTRNLDRHRMVLFNESYVFDSILEDKEFPLFSNSYLVIVGPKLPIEYVKYSNDRSREYAIRTEICQNKVRKVALCPEACEHLKKLSTYYELLHRRYEGSKLRINKCSYDESSGIATFPFEKGRTLEELFDERLFSGDMEGFRELFDEYVKRISYNNGVEITDYDLIFANILVEDDQWTIIDYEWSEQRLIPDKEVAFRGLYCYLLEDERRNCLNFDGLLDSIGITQYEAEGYREKELSFQKRVSGRHQSIGEIKATIGTYEIDIKELFKDRLKNILRERIQLYYDRGSGFSEEDSVYAPDVFVEPNHIVTDIKLDGNVKTLRIDPADHCCVVKINELVFNGENLLKNKKVIETNGKTVNFGTYAFVTADPNVVIGLNDVLIRGDNTLHVDMEVIPVTEGLASDIANSIKKFF